MFTGIVEEVGRVVSVGTGKLVVTAERVTDGIQRGGSIAVNGVCLTITDFNNTSFTVEIMPETLRKSNIGLLRPGDRVNLERPLALGGEIGGHLVQGHIDGTAKVASIVREGDAILMRFQSPPDILRYVVNKGFIAVDGTSLTVTEKDAASFGVSIVGFTRDNTILSARQPGDTVNLEADIIGKYVAEYVSPQSTGITAEFLTEHGFALGEN